MIPRIGAARIKQLEYHGVGSRSVLAWGAALRVAAAHILHAQWCFRGPAHQVRKDTLTVLWGRQSNNEVLTRSRRSTSIGHQIGGDSHTTLVDSLVKTNVVPANSRLERALRAVDRAAFAPLDVRATAASYENRPLKIGVIATISTPQQHAQVMGLLEEHMRPGATALDVGCGSGYLVAAMAHLVGATGSVTGVDIVPELVEFSKQNLAAVLDDELLSATTILQSSSKHVLGDLVPGSQFDAIHVGVAVETKAEAELYLDILKPGGGLLIPLGRGGQEQKLVKV
jgi:protein-L-isoaspartate(D-aspartate) O-methyltransferase